MTTELTAASLSRMVKSTLPTPHIKSITHSKAPCGLHQVRVQFHEKELSTNAQAVTEKIRVLRKYTSETGFKTTRSQNDLLQTLDGNDLANALLVLNEER